MSFVTIISPCFVSHLCVESRFFNYVWLCFGFFRLMYPILLIFDSLTFICQYLWIVHFWLPLRYSLSFTCQFFWIVHFWLPLRYSLTFIFQFLWIVHFWLPLRFSLTFISNYNTQFNMYTTQYRCIILNIVLLIKR